MIFLNFDQEILSDDIIQIMTSDEKLARACRISSNLNDDQHLFISIIYLDECFSLVTLSIQSSSKMEFR
jgi:hypothetical protein